ncbi:MAG: hypothetical protein WEE50_02310 [Chloroflexota bacterium]
MPPTARRTFWSTFKVIALATLLAACSAGGASIVAPSSDASPPATGANSSESDAWLVVGERGEPGLRVILASTREQLFELPLGVPSERWSHVVAATTSGEATMVNEITVQPELPTWRSRSVEGAWRLPTIGVDPLPVGVVNDGSTIVNSTIVLVEADPPAGATTSRFAILARSDPARIIELPGALEFDALSPDGSILYVVEHLAGPPDSHYQVRAIDLPSGAMRETVIADKRNLGASMAGWPITQATHESGVVFTLYRGVMHPFIHALNTREAWAVCLDLPEIGHQDSDAALDWGIAQSADGRGVFAVNATLGLAAAIDPGELSIRQATAFDAPRAAATIELAKFGHAELDPVGRRVVATPDGSTVLAAGAGGIVRLETERLTVRGRFLEGTSIEALALPSDEKTAYALTGDGRILRLDAGTGELLGQVPGEGYDRLVAMDSW